MIWRPEKRRKILPINHAMVWLRCARCVLVWLMPTNIGDAHCPQCRKAEHVKKRWVDLCWAEEGGKEEAVERQDNAALAKRIDALEREKRALLERLSECEGDE